MAPGGKLAEGETPEGALKRELNEELGIVIELSDLEKFETFYAPAARQEEKYLQMDVFFVHRWDGAVQANSEIEEIMWIDSSVPAEVSLGSIFEHEVLPRLKQANLID